MINKKMIKGTILGILMAGALAVTGCSSGDVQSILNTPVSSVAEGASDVVEGIADLDEFASDKKVESESGSVAAPAEKNTSDKNSSAKSTSNAAASGSAQVAKDSLIDTSDLFSERDLTQEADLTEATSIELTDGEDVNITSEGVYVLTGSAKNVSIIVEAADTDKVQLVLDSVSITNTDSPAIYVKSADKVFVTTTDSSNSLSVTGTFTADSSTNTDAVIYSKDDLVLNGKGTLSISSTANGISGKDDLKITGGTYVIASTEDAIEANDSIAIYDGSFDITSKKDAFHCENSDDNSVGYVYINGGTFKLAASEDGIQATTVLMIDGGTFDITGAEGLEATYVQINGGTISISASDDGINATQKSTIANAVIEVNGGDITVVMGSGDTDGFDANGYIYINGGTINVTGNSAFDFDMAAELNGGTVTVNGEKITTIENSMMGDGMGGFGSPQNFQNGQMNGGFGGRGKMQGGQPGNFDGSQMTPPDGQMPQGQMQKGNKGH